MKKCIPFITILALIINLETAYAQTGNVGIGTTTPGSKLTVNGSFAAAYNTITATTYTAGENDFYIVWNGTAAGTITLPASTSGPDRTGRLYFFKNTSAVYTLTIDAAGTELIDNSQTLVLQPGEAGMLVKTNIHTAAGITYELVQISQTQPDYTYAVSSTTVENHAQGANILANFTQVDFSPNGGADFNLATDVWTCPQSGYYRIEFMENGSTSAANSSAHRHLQIVKNGAPQSEQFYNLVNVSTTGVNNSGYNSTVRYLVQGDQITARMVLCSGCGAASMASSSRRLFITRL